MEKHEAMRGNIYWQLRSKHGRKKLFETPEILWEEAVKYFQYCDDNPFIEEKPMVVSKGNNEGSEVIIIEVKKKRPYTWMSLCLFLNTSQSYFRSYKSAADPEKQKDFLAIYAAIEQSIYSQQYDGAASGFFNHNIIARALGLSEKTEVDVSDNRKQVSDLFPTELKQLGKE